MRVVCRLWALCLSLAVIVTWAADIPPHSVLTPAQLETHETLYYWQSSNVDNTAQLLTLFCRSCQTLNTTQVDVPLVAVLRDTLGDGSPENDRVASVWLLTYSKPNIGRKFLSAIPFFFWRAGKGGSSVSSRDIKPFFDLTQPQHPVWSEVGRDLLQWTMFDPMTTPVRATSRAYRTNELDEERLHLEEAISYLRQAPASNDSSALTATQRDTVIARLDLRKRLLGGLVTEGQAASLGEESGYEEERIRSRNWELLRQCAEKTGLLFEPINLSGTNGQYAVVWFPLNEPLAPHGTSLVPVWKILNLRNPWVDNRLRQWKGPVFTRVLDNGGSLLPEGETGSRQVRLVPLGVYSLDYPKVPLLLVDFRDKLHVRWHEITQRSINEITAGVIGISHFTNWYYYVGAELYDFVIARHGGAMNQAARLDSYSQFRVKLALDQEMNPQLRQEMQRRVDSLAINPLESAPAQEIESARARYALLQAQTQAGGALVTRLDKQRRAEIAAFSETMPRQITQDMLHAATLGLYTNRVKQDPENLSTLNRNRRLQYHVSFLESLAEAGTRPEIAYDSSRIRASVNALSDLLPSVSSTAVRVHVEAVLLRLKSLSQDRDLQADCSAALASLKDSRPSARETEISGVVTYPHSVFEPSNTLDARK